MSKTTLSDSIKKLEKVSLTKADEVKDLLEKDYDEILKAVESLKPYLEKVREQVEHEVEVKKEELELKMKKNPWVTIGIVGLFAFFVGWLVGRKK